MCGRLGEFGWCVARLSRSFNPKSFQPFSAFPSQPLDLTAPLPCLHAAQESLQPGPAADVPSTAVSGSCKREHGQCNATGTATEASTGTASKLRRCIPDDERNMSRDWKPPAGTKYVQHRDYNPETSNFDKIITARGPRGRTTSQLSVSHATTHSFNTRRSKLMRDQLQGTLPGIPEGGDQGEVEQPVWHRGGRERGGSGTPPGADGGARRGGGGDSQGGQRQVCGCGLRGLAGLLWAPLSLWERRVMLLTHMCACDAKHAPTTPYCRHPFGPAAANAA